MKFSVFNLLNISFLILFSSSIFQADAQNATSSENSQAVKTEQIAKVKKAEKWDALLERKSGWFGGDGIFGIPMNGAEFKRANDKSKTMFIFSDSVVADSVSRGMENKDFTMVHNCVAYLEGSEPDPSKFEFYIHKDEKGNPTSLFVPNTPSAKSNHYYWMGDGFVNVDHDSTLYIFAYPVKDTIIPGAFFEFEQLGVNLIAIPKGSKPPFKDQRQMETPFFFPLENWNKATMGSAIFVNTESAGAPNPDGYIYVYGVGGVNNGLVVARVRPENFEKFDQWEFSAGPNWTTDFTKSYPVTRQTSNEMSLSPMEDGRYILVHQFFGMEQEVAVQLTKHPAGPFFPVRKIWECTEWEKDLDYFAYNAKAFPHLSKPGELLIAYNTNSMDFWNDIKTNPWLCLPKFFTFKY